MQNQIYYFLDDISPPEAETPFKPVILDSNIDVDKAKSISPVFNTAKVYLDGRLDSSLDWTFSKQAASNFISHGKRIFWELDLGLFAHLFSPISDQTQYLTLGLAIKHFRDTLWKEFSTHSIGISIYRGSLDFSSQLKWNDEQIAGLHEWLQDRSIPSSDLSDLQQTKEGRSLLSLFCCDTAIDYLDLLGAQMPGELPVCVCLDANAIDDPFLLGMLLSKERFERLSRVISADETTILSLTSQPEGFLANSEINEGKESLGKEKPKIGICLPIKSSFCSEPLNSLKQASDLLMKKNIPFRFISEASLTIEWDGLDQILVPSNLNPQGLRKLRGFCAAGGTVLYLDNFDASTVSNAMPFKDFISQ